MPLLALTLAAGVAAGPVPNVNDPDLRCIAVIAAAGGQSKTPNPGLVGGLFYFLGRLDARAPGFDIEGGIRALLAAPDVAATLKPDVARCSAELAERGAFLKKMGDSLQGKK